MTVDTLQCVVGRFRVYYYYINNINKRDKQPATGATRNYRYYGEKEVQKKGL